MFVVVVVWEVSLLEERKKPLSISLVWTIYWWPMLKTLLYRRCSARARANTFFYLPLALRLPNADSHAHINLSLLYSSPFSLLTALRALNFLLCIFRIPPTIPVRVFILGGILSSSPHYSFFFFFFRSDSIRSRECYLHRPTSHSIQNRTHTHTHTAHRAWKTLCNKWLSLTRLFLFVSSTDDDDDDERRQRKKSVLLWLLNRAVLRRSSFER